MYRYHIEFSIKSLDESELRNLLGKSFGVSEITIIRTPGDRPRSNSPQNEFERQILAALLPGKPARRKHLLADIGSPSQKAAVRSALQRLEARGAIRKPRHGVFVIAGAPDPAEREIPAMGAAFPTPAQKRILELLTGPRTAVELRHETQVTRQRVDQILGRLIESGAVIRNEVTGERGQYVYIRSDADDRELLLTRQPNLSEARARVLSAVPAERICSIRTVGDTVKRTSAQLAIWFEQFSAQGLVATFRLGRRRYVGLTPRGFNHPQYDITAEKASGADLVSDFGPTRSRFLQVIFALGELKTNDITRALPTNFLGSVRYRSGQVVQRLETSGLIEKIGGGSRKRCSYRLTAKGGFAAATLNRLQPPPNAAELRSAIEASHKSHSKRIRNDGSKRFGTLAMGSLTQDAAVRALQEGGPMKSGR